MKNNVEIVNLVKKEYVQKTKVYHHNRLIPFCSSLIVIFLLIFSFGTSGIKNFGSNLSSIYNPVNSLYNDNSGIVFTSSMLNDKALDFVVPIKSYKNIDIYGGTVRIDVGNSILVFASENGVVCDIGVTLDGIKYIKIQHTPSIFSIIENIDVIGTSENVVVKKGQDIATAKVDQYIIFKLYCDDNLVTDITINQSKILWQS